MGEVMIKYAREWESHVTDSAAEGLVTEKLMAEHERRICWLQHERHMHLLVMLFTLAINLVLFVMVYLGDDLLVGILLLILTVLSLFYVKHYYELENTVQRWYKLYDQLVLGSKGENNP